MTRELSVSSVTQTWLVSRRHSKNRKTISEECDEQTVTICRPSLVIWAKSSDGTSTEHLSLSLGTHRFFLDGESGLQKQNLLEGPADFEIDLNAAGAFFFSLSEEHFARVNGKKVGWVRLRNEDEIEVGNWILRVDPGTVLAEDQTVLARRIAGSEKSDKGPKERLKRFGGLAIFLVILPAMLMIALIGGYMLAQSQMRDATVNEQEVVGRSAKDLITQTSETRGVPISNVTDVASVETEAKTREGISLPFGKHELENIVEEFRSGDRGTACRNLRRAIDTADKGVWRSKGLLFLKRRCTET